ncbi:MAG: FkbM family methyltransferase [Saprospiraceae bacterium]|nr:FkbM family methyltransferase [Saprospiraceae bacterium]
MIKSLIKNALKSIGYRIEKTGSETDLTMNGALSRCLERGVKVNTVIDVGASDGSWTRDCLKHYPNANYLLIEAQQPHKQALDKFCQGNPNVKYVLAAAGRKEGKIFFDNSALFGGLASETPLEGNSIEVDVISIDAEIQRRNLKGPFLVKLDTHGFEVPILEGAEKTLKETSLTIIEVYNYKLTDTSLRYFEMCEYMNKLGFLSVEMVDFMLRKLDLSLWQMDLFFISSKSNEFNNNSFD